MISTPGATRAEAEQIKRAAEAAGLSISEWVRQCLLSAARPKNTRKEDRAPDEED
jgi:hypothetical protein